MKPCGSQQYKHSDIFLRLAERYYSENAINERLDWFLSQEAAICSKLPNRAAPALILNDKSFFKYLMSVGVILQKQNRIENY